ncbi:MAG: TetR/AcrR family transcriptional regulator [Desulfobacteraceae bacterium]|nr:TetR/AcrR family transcriptional regulator [Desulfobacteraceae bacterium]MBC2754305.1 TetR/AcrR family transcriptional regulator [Desulfobacteraceae bacterium]
MKTARGKKEIRQIREKILESALDIIVFKGLDGLTMRNLAQKTGMTAPNLYNYFSNKDEIYIHIIIRGFDMLYADLKAAYDLHEDKADRLRAMIDTYMTFGISKPRYYDIMFTRPTPKYNDYIGTPLEKISKIEYKISMDIAALAIKAAADVIGPSAGEEILTRRLVQLWSLIHGMITLNNSQVMGYVAESAEQVYQKIIDEVIDSLK